MSPVTLPHLRIARRLKNHRPAHWPDLAADWLERARRPTDNLISTRERARRFVTLERNINAMSTKYEDNFGFYCIDDDDLEELEFFCHIRAQSEPTIWARCNQKVRLLEHIKICATCAEALEYGAPSDPAWVVPNLWSVVRREVRS
jgi:hypothetical protein